MATQELVVKVKCNVQFTKSATALNQYTKSSPAAIVTLLKRTEYIEHSSSQPGCLEIEWKVEQLLDTVYAAQTAITFTVADPDVMNVDDTKLLPGQNQFRLTALQKWFGTGSTATEETLETFDFSILVCGNEKVSATTPIKAA